MRQRICDGGSSPLLEHQNEIEEETVQKGDQEKDDGVQLEADAVDAECFEDVVTG